MLWLWLKSNHTSCQERTNSKTLYFLAHMALTLATKWLYKLQETNNKNMKKTIQNNSIKN